MKRGRVTTAKNEGRQSRNDWGLFADESPAHRPRQREERFERWPSDEQAKVDFAAVATGYGYGSGYSCDDPSGLAQVLAPASSRDEPHSIHMKITPGSIANLGKRSICLSDVARRLGGFLALHVRDRRPTMITRVGSWRGYESGSGANGRPWLLGSDERDRPLVLVGQVRTTRPSGRPVIGMPRIDFF